MSDNTRSFLNFKMRSRSYKEKYEGRVFKHFFQRTCPEFLVCQKMAVWWLHRRQLALVSFAASMGPTQQIQISLVDINPPEGVLAVFFCTTFKSGF